MAPTMSRWSSYDWMPEHVVAERKRSAGLLVFRRRDGVLEVLIGHMGGPLWAHREGQAWSLPKGLYEPEEDAAAAARREFEEETGLQVPTGDWLALGSVRQRSGKEVTVWAVEGDLDASAAVSNMFTMEWPRGSGQRQDYPELDRCIWTDLDRARVLLVAGQVPFLDRLVEQLAG